MLEYKPKFESQLMGDLFKVFYLLLNLPKVRTQAHIDGIDSFEVYYPWF
jgi:hypothetical protein